MGPRRCGPLCMSFVNASMRSPKPRATSSDVVRKAASIFAPQPSITSAHSGKPAGRLCNYIILGWQATGVCGG